MFRFDVCVVGGCGRVGLPLAVAFADKGLKVVIHDLDKEKLAQVKSGVMPFREEGCQEKLQSVLKRTLSIGDNPTCISESHFIIVTIGTPVDKHLNPDFSAMLAFFKNLLPHLVAGHYIVLRSTVYPGTADKVHRFLEESGVCNPRVATSSESGRNHHGVAFGTKNAHSLEAPRGFA